MNAPAYPATGPRNPRNRPPGSRGGVRRGPQPINPPANDNGLNRSRALGRLGQFYGRIILPVGAGLALYNYWQNRHQQYVPVSWTSYHCPLGDIRGKGYSIWQMFNWNGELTSWCPGLVGNPVNYPSQFPYWLIGPNTHYAVHYRYWKKYTGALNRHQSVDVYHNPGHSNHNQVNQPYPQPQRNPIYTPFQPPRRQLPRRPGWNPRTPPPRPQPPSRPNPYTPPVIPPGIPPSIDPFTQPPAQPIPAHPPEPIPYPQIPGRPLPNPNRVDQPEVGPGPAPGPTPGPTHIFDQGRVPGTVPGTRGTPTQPPPGDRERKIRFSDQAAYRIIDFVLDQITEGQELVRAFWDALPQSCRHARGYYNTAGQLGDLYDCWEQVDIAEALYNVFENHVEDQIIGRFNEQLRRAVGDDTWSEYIRFKLLQYAGRTNAGAPPPPGDQQQQETP